MKNQFVKNQIELGSTETMEPETSFNLSDNKTNIINLCVSNPALADPKTQLGRLTQTHPEMRQKLDILGMIFVIFPQKVTHHVKAHGRKGRGNTHPLERRCKQMLDTFPCIFCTKSQWCPKWP